MASSKAAKVVSLQQRGSCPAYGQAEKLLSESSRIAEGYYVRGVYITRTELARRIRGAK